MEGRLEGRSLQKPIMESQTDKQTGNELQTVTMGNWVVVGVWEEQRRRCDLSFEAVGFRITVPRGCKSFSGLQYSIGVQFREQVLP